jgi:hypothetical protein
MSHPRSMSMVGGKGAGFRVKFNGENSGRSGLDGWGHPTVKSVSFEELLMSQVVQQEALTRLLIEKGVFTKEEFLEMVNKVNQEMSRR